MTETPPIVAIKTATLTPPIAIFSVKASAAEVGIDVPPVNGD